MEMVTLWLFVCGITIIAELQNPGLFYFLSLACGAAAALASCLYGQPIDIQIAWCAAIAALAWTLLKRIAQSKRVAPYHSTNTDALLGKRAQVIERIAYPEKGYVKVGGEGWPAISREVSIEVGEYVEVVGVVGNHLIVKRI